MTRSRRFALLAACALFATAGIVRPAGAAADAPPPATSAEARPSPPEIPSPRPDIAAGEVTTPRFRVVYTRASEGVARSLAERIEGVRDHFQSVIGRDWPGVTEIRVGLGRDEFEALALPGGRPPRWAEALAYPGHNIILLDGHSLSRPQGEITLRHELSHVALGRMAEGWPHWFQEGLAMFLTGDRLAFTQYAAMFRAVTQERIFAFSDLSQGWPQHPSDVEIAYAQSVSFVSYLIERYGPQKMGELVDHVRGGAAFELAFARSFQSTLRVEQEAWEKTLPARYSWLPIVTGGTAIWTLAAGITVIGWVRRRRVRRRRMAEMEEQEEAEAAARKLALAINRAPPAGDEAGEFSGITSPEEFRQEHADEGASSQRHGHGTDSDDLDAQDEEDDVPGERKPRRTLH